MKDFCVEEKVQLKVCEGCGALWLRGQSEGVYCGACAHWLSEFPAPKRLSRHARRRKNRRERAAEVLPMLAGLEVVVGGAR